MDKKKKNKREMNINGMSCTWSGNYLNSSFFFLASEFAGAMYFAFNYAMQSGCTWFR